MFLCAVARPRFDTARNCTFDGKIGVWAFVEKKAALKKSKNRKRGALELKPIPVVNKEVSRTFLITRVIPAIEAKWPAEDRHQTIYIQQDNAKTHVSVNDKEVLEAAQAGG